MISYTIRRVTGMLAVLAAPAVIFTAALPASAVATSGPHGKMCETYSSYCLHANTLQTYDIIYEGGLSGARYITAVPQSGTYLSHPLYKLQFTFGSSWCVGAIDNGLEVDVVVKPCTGDLSTVWAQDGSRWINLYWSTHQAPPCNDVSLAGQEISGITYKLYCLGGGGYFYQFTFKQ